MILGGRTELGPGQQPFCRAAQTASLCTHRYSRDPRQCLCWSPNCKRASREALTHRLQVSTTTALFRRARKDCNSFSRPENLELSDSLLWALQKVPSVKFQWHAGPDSPSLLPLPFQPRSALKAPIPSALLLESRVPKPRGTGCHPQDWHGMATPSQGRIKRSQEQKVTGAKVKPLASQCRQQQL